MANKIRTSISLSKEILDALENSRSAGQQFVSGRISSVISRYLLLLEYGHKELKSVLTKREIQYIIRVMSGKSVDEDNLSLWLAHGLPHAIYNPSLHADEDPEAHLNRYELSERVGELTFYARLALIELTEQARGLGPNEIEDRILKEFG